MSKQRFQKLFTQRLIVFLLILLQIGFMIFLTITSSKSVTIVKYILTAVSILVALHIVTRREAGAYKLVWIFLILLFPVFGWLFYLIFNGQRSAKGLNKKVTAIHSITKENFTLYGDCIEEARAASPNHVQQINYLQNCCGFPVYSGTYTQYLSPGEEKFRVMLEEMKKAEKYIFIEYFIVEDGYMWSSVLEVMREKAAQGIDVRMIYDDIGCLLRIPTDFISQLKKYGIKCTVFNPFRPVLTALQNNRDHRKITVIDGRVAITGGVNLADEYINRHSRFGHWKDASVLLRGPGAWSFTVMFLQMWALCTGVHEDYGDFFPNAPAEDCGGFVQPYTDSPLDLEDVNEHVYLRMINGAKKYIYINTPYLIINDQFMSALTQAAKSGVDVRIVTPHRWDKWYVHITTRSFYKDLIEEGVKIYEYSSGFIHSKTFVADDEVATIGTANLDYRSLYLHFECGVCLYKTDAVMELKEDFLKTLQSCQQITEKDCPRGFFKTLLQDFFRLFAPLL